MKKTHPCKGGSFSCWYAYYLIQKTLNVLCTVEPYGHA